MSLQRSVRLFSSQSLIFSSALQLQFRDKSWICWGEEMAVPDMGRYKYEKPTFDRVSFLSDIILLKMVQSIEQQAINTVRVLAADVVRGANSGHPGMQMERLCYFVGVKDARLTVLPDNLCRCSYGLRSYGPRPVQQVHHWQPKEPQVHQP